MKIAILSLMLLLLPATLLARPFRAGTTTQTISASVAQTSVVVLPANPRRVWFSMYNNGANTVYLTYGPTSSGSTPTRALATFASFETGEVCYTGAISAIRNAGSGTIVSYEMTETAP